MCGRECKYCRSQSLEEDTGELLRVAAAIWLRAMDDRTVGLGLGCGRRRRNVQGEGHGGMRRRLAAEVAAVAIVAAGRSLPNFLSVPREWERAVVCVVLA